MQFKFLFFSLLTLILMGQGCTSIRVVKPLPKGDMNIGLNAGGPLIEFGGTPIFVPLSAFYTAYGVSDKFTLTGGLHTTSLAFKNLQLDAGLLYGVRDSEGWIPGLSLSAMANFTYGFSEGESRLGPQADFHLFWESGEKSLVYAGSSFYMDLYPNASQPAHRFKSIWPTINLGYNRGNEKWNFGIEYKILAPGRDNRDGVIDFIEILPGMTSGLYFNVSRKL
jgi:hypothetical protein